MNLVTKAIYLCIVFCLPFAFHSCTTCTCQKVPCGRYADPKMDDWITSFSNSKIVFENSSQSTDTFLMPAAQKSEVYEANKGCEGAEPGCISSLMLYSNNFTSTGRAKFFINYRSLTSWDNNTSKQITISVHDFEIVADNVSDTGFLFLNGRVSSAFSPSIALGGHTFLNVQRMQIDTNLKSPGIYKIYFAKYMGLVAYEEYPSKKLWVRQ